MAKKLTSVLGIDIGSQKIKIAEVRSQGREPTVSALGMIDTPEGAVDHTGVYNSDAVGAALKQLISESGATVPYAIVSIAGQASVLVRTLEVPRMNPSELSEHMQWEINRNIPFAESNVVSDFRALADEDPNSQNMDVVMAISPQSAIDTLIGCVKKAGKTVAAIDVEPLAMARALRMSYDDLLQAETVCVVEVGHKTTSINIYRDGKLLMPRQVPIGGEMFTSAIADAYGVAHDEAERLKIERASIPSDSGQASAAPTFAPSAPPSPTQEFVPYNPFADEPGFVPPPVAEEGEVPPVEDSMANPAGFEPEQPDPPSGPDLTPVASGDPEAQRIYNAISVVLEEFVAEVRRSIDYFRSRGGDVSRIEICGGGGRLKGLPAFLQRSVGIPCDELDPLRRLNLNARKVAPGFVDEYKHHFAIAIGNGLHIFYD
jgi:type IV pilus assembly protein PilM